MPTLHRAAGADTWPLKPRKPTMHLQNAKSMQSMPVPSCKFSDIQALRMAVGRGRHCQGSAACMWQCGCLCPKGLACNRKVLPDVRPVHLQLLDNATQPGGDSALCQRRHLSCYGCRGPSWGRRLQLPGWVPASNSPCPTPLTLLGLVLLPAGQHGLRRAPTGRQHLPHNCHPPEPPLPNPPGHAPAPLPRVRRSGRSCASRRASQCLPEGWPNPGCHNSHKASAWLSRGLRMQGDFQ